jgi:hypothetical protein
MSALFSCTQCSKTFTRSSNLQRHIACVHEEQRRFVCPEPDCRKSFKRKRDLDGHVYATHLHICPFVCEVAGCTAAFARQEQLRLHKKTHTDGASVALTTAPPVPVLAAARAKSARRKRCAPVVPEHDDEDDDDDADADDGDDDDDDGVSDDDDDAHRRDGGSGSGARVAKSSAVARRAPTAPIVPSASVDASVAHNAAGAPKAKRVRAAGTKSSRTAPPEPNFSAVASLPLPPVTQKLFLDAAEEGRLVKHENHIDAIIGGRLLSLQDLAEHDMSGAIDWCNLIDSGCDQHEHDNCHATHAHVHGHACDAHEHPAGLPLPTSTCVDVDEFALHQPTLASLQLHEHSHSCGHVPVRHGDHVDFLVGDELRHDLGGGKYETHGYLNLLSLPDVLGESGVDNSDWLELFSCDKKDKR